MTIINNVKKGEFFTRKPISNPTEKQVWVRGEYIRSANAYSCTRFSDTSDEILIRSGREVFTDFVF